MKEKICYNEKFKKNKSAIDEYDDGPYDYMTVTSAIVEPSHSDEYLDVDESLVEIANAEEEKSTFRLEMNVIEFPMFTKSSKVKINKSVTYHFSKNDKSYLEALPLFNDSIPGEFEEKVFFSLLKIFKEKGYNKIFYCTSSEIVKNLTNIANTQASYLGRIKKSIRRLSGCRYVFSNLFYLGEHQNKINDVINTNLFNFRVFSLKELPDSEKINFRDNRVKDVYRIDLSDYIYKNLTNKAYLVFEFDKLLEIKNSVARSIYMQITKWRNKKLFLEKTAFYIARKVPLSWTNPTRAIKQISSALNELKATSHISDFEEVCKGKKDTTIFKIYFSEEHNKLKDNNFLDDRNTFETYSDDSVIDYIEEKDVVFPDAPQVELPVVSSITSETPITRDVKKEMDNVIKVLGPKVSALKTINPVVSNALNNHDYEYVLYTAEYTAMYAKKSILKYFKDALVNNWADEYIAKKKIKLEKKQPKFEIINPPILEEPEFEIVSGHKKYRNTSYTFEEYNKLPEDKRDVLIKIVSEDFYKKTGPRNPTNEAIFNKSLKGLVIGFNDLYAELTTPAPEVPIKKVEHVEIFKGYINLVPPPQPTKEVPNVDKYESVISFVMKTRTKLNDYGFDYDAKLFKETIDIFGVVDEFDFYAEYDEKTKDGKFYIKNIK